MIRAHADLLARLAESGWSVNEHASGDHWYDVVLHGTALAALSGSDRVRDLLGSNQLDLH